MALSAFTELSHSWSSCLTDPSFHQALHYLVDLMRKQPWIRSGVDDAAGDDVCNSVHDAEVVAGGKTDRRADRRADGRAADAACATRGIFASAPGRIELAGNHVDHQGGKTISAAFDKRCYALARLNNTSLIRMAFSGFGSGEIDLSDETWDQPREDEKEASVGLVRGMVAGCAHRGCKVSGFDLVTYSDIPVGCGVSSSAAFEVCVGGCLSALFDSTGDHAIEEVDSPTFLHQCMLDPSVIACDAVEAEQRYFGKPCGAQDQTASAYGAVLCLDFQSDPPRVQQLPYPLESAGYVACLIDSQCNHALFTSDFAAIPEEMNEVAHYFGAARLHEVNEQTFLAELPAIRAQVGDRPVLRALHYYNEVRRVDKQAQALRSHDVRAFLQNVLYSGASSAQYLQNVELPKSDKQTLLVIMALCDTLLEGRGAWRIHGGGFGGSVIAFVPNDEVDTFRAAMTCALGFDQEDESACMVVHVGGAGVEAFAVSL